MPWLLGMVSGLSRCQITLNIEEIQRAGVGIWNYQTIKQDKQVKK